MKLPSLSSLVIPPWVKIAWRLAPWLALCLSLSALGITRSTLHNVRQNDVLLSVQSELASKTQELGWTQRLSLAQGTYLDTLKNLSAVKDKSDEDTKAFAATPAGATSCLSLDRVQSVLSHRSALEAASTPEGGSGEVPTSGDTPKGPDGK